MISRRQFLKLGGAGMLTLYAASRGKFLPRAFAQIPGGALNPDEVDKFVTPLLIPPVMPKAGTIKQKGGKNVDYYEISMKQFAQQILPAGLPATTVWGYGAVAAENKRGLLLHNAPSLTIEADWNRPVRVKWINDLKEANGDFLPHLLPVDPTLHWANPPGGAMGRDMRPDFTDKTYVPLADFTDPATQYTQYTGPVPIVTHVHGAVGVGDVVRIELPIDAHLPHDYVPSERLRLEMYKRLAEVRSDDDVRLLHEEMLDRYGNPPAPVTSLLQVARFRARARQAGISEVTMAGKNVRFAPVSLPDSRVVRLHRLYPKSLVKAATDTVLVPRPGMGVQALRDEALLEWAREVIDTVLAPGDAPQIKEPTS